jgi:O-antigen/teichoic acid export membrane protein
MSATLTTPSTCINNDAATRPIKHSRGLLRRVIPAANAIFLGHAIVRIGSLILVPLFLRYWSAPRYGEYVALFAAVAYLSSLDVGMQWATVNRLTQAYARGDHDDYQKVQHTAIVFYVLLAVAVTAGVAALVWFLPVTRWIGLRLTPSPTASIAIIFLAAYVMWSMPMRLLCATYQTMGNLARTQWIANIQQVLTVVLTAAALLLGRGIVAIAVLQLLTVAFVIAYVLAHLRRHAPALLPAFNKATITVLKELARPSALFALLVIGNLVAYQGSTLLVSATLGGLAVAVLSISKAIIEVVRQSLYSVNLALCPDFARMEALGEFEQLRRVHRLTVAAVAAISIAVAAAVWYEGGLIISVWTRGRIEPDITLLRLFLVLMVLQTPWAASSTVATATNRHHAQAIGYFFAAVIGVGMVGLLVHRLGTWAVPLGLTIGEAVACYHFVIRASCRIIGEHYGRFATRFWLGFVATFVAALTTAWAVHTFTPGPFLLRWLAMGIATTAVASVSGWFVWLTSADRELLLPKLRPVLVLCGIKM